MTQAAAMKGCIFDLDGTLLDTLPDLSQSANMALKTFDLPERRMEDIRRFVGHGVRRLIAQAVPEGTPEDVEAKVFEAFTAIYAERMMVETVPYVGIPALLQTLKEEGVALAVLSNKKEEAVVAMMAHYFPGLFQWAWGEVALRPRKPSPEGLLQLIEAMHLTPREVCYIGDSEVDVATGKAAGVYTIACSWGFRDRETLAQWDAEVLVDSPEQLAMCLKAMII